MRKFLLPVLAAAALVGGHAVKASAASHSEAAIPNAVAVGPDAAIQHADYYGEDWRAREWRHHEREEWRRREAWHRWHREHDWRGRYSGDRY